MPRSHLYLVSARAPLKICSDSGLDRRISRIQVQRWAGLWLCLSLSLAGCVEPTVAPTLNDQMDDSLASGQDRTSGDLDEGSQTQTSTDQNHSLSDLGELITDLDHTDMHLTSEDQELVMTPEDLAVDVDDAALMLDERDAELDMEALPLDRSPPPEPDVGQSEPSPLAFTEVYFSATHNSYEGGPRRSVREQLESGVRAIEYDIHDNDFSQEGYRLGHLRHGEAVSRGGGNPSTDALGAWLDVVESWSSEHPGHAPLLLTIDLKDNLMDNRSYAEGNLAHLNAALTDRLSRMWRPEDGTDDVDAARDHVLCILSGDGGTRRGYLYDVGSSPALAINSSGRALEVHDSGSGYLWYWGGRVTGDQVIWRRHGRYDTGRRPAVLINSLGQVIEVHQSERHDRLWASVGSMNSNGELTLDAADRFSDGAQPSVAWRDMARGTFAVRYIRDGRIYERQGNADMRRREIDWGEEQSTPSGSGLFVRNEVSYAGRQFRVTPDQAPDEYPLNTLWLQVTSRGVTSGAPIRYEQVCFVEWQRDEHRDPLLGRQYFGALPGGDYARLPARVRREKMIRGWEYSGRSVQASVPQIPSTDYPFSTSYVDFMDDLDAIE